MTVRRFAQVNIGTVALAVHPIHYIVDTTAELPTSALKLGDTAIALDTLTQYKASSTTAWAAIGGSVSLPTSGNRATVAKIGSTITARDAVGTLISSGTDASTVLNAAIEAVRALDGGNVFVGAGTYTLTSTVSVLPGVDLQGETGAERFNFGGHIIPAGTVFSGALDPMVSVPSASSPTDGFGSWIQGIAFDNSGAMGSSKAVQIAAMDTTVSRCTFEGFSVGYDCIGNSSTGSTAAGANRLILSEFAYCAQNVWIDRLSPTNRPTDGQIFGCRFLTNGNTDTGYSVILGAGGWHILMCHFTQSGAGAGTSHLQVTSGPAMIENNYFDTSGMTYKIDLATSESMFVGNYILGSGAGTQVNAASNFGVIANNFFQGDDSATVGLRYAAAQASLKGVCQGNVFVGFSGNAIQDSTGAAIANGFTAGAGTWPAFSADGNVAWT